LVAGSLGCFVKVAEKIIQGFSIAVSEVRQFHVPQPGATDNGPRCPRRVARRAEKLGQCVGADPGFLRLVTEGAGVPAVTRYSQALSGELQNAAPILVDEDPQPITG
jgi:hypothetical protein